MKDLLIALAIEISGGILGIFLFGLLVHWGLDKMTGSGGLAGTQWLEVQKMLKERKQKNKQVSYKRETNILNKHKK